MKTVIILNGTVESIMRQAEELNNYIIDYFAGNHEIEAWIISHREINAQTIVFSHQIKSIKVAQVGPNHVAEEYLTAITAIYEIIKPEIMVFGSDLFAAGLAVRAAYRLKGSSCVGVSGNQYSAGQFIVEKRVYSNNLTAKFKMRNKPFCISIAKSFRHKIEIRIAERVPEVERIGVFSINANWLQKCRCQVIETANGLNTAKIVIAVGKGIGSIKNIGLFEQLAEHVGGKLGASRPVVMNAWRSMEDLIGTSGSVISPDLCIAIGISGAAAFIVGIEKSEFIIAINKDEKAAIFKFADVAVCAEYQEIIAELLRLLKSN